MQRLFCSDIGHYTREDTNPVFPVVQELQFSSAIGESEHYFGCFHFCDGV